MNAVAHPHMFETAYRQITDAERSFVDTIVRELVEAARRLGQRIALALNRPLPDALLARDTRGWLQRPLVRAAITEQINALALAEEINLENTARELHAIAHFNIQDVLRYDAIGDPYFDLEGASREQMAAIKSIEIEKSDGLTRSSKTKIKIQTHDKVAALKMEMALMGVEDGDSPYRKSDRSGRVPTLTNDATAEQVGDAYASMIGE